MTFGQPQGESLHRNGRGIFDSKFECTSVASAASSKNCVYHSEWTSRYLGLHDVTAVGGILFGVISHRLTR